MKIIVIFKGGFPTGLAMTNRLLLYCKGLIEEKQEVKLVIPIKSDSFKNQINFQTSGIYENIPFEYLSNSTIRSKYFIKRKLDDFLGYIKLIAYLVAKKNRADIFLIVDLRNNFRFIIVLLALLKKSKVIYEINEHPILLIYSIFGKRIGYYIETRLLYPLFDGFIVISDSLYILINKYKGRKAKIIQVPIIAEPPKITANSNFKCNANPYIFHSGSLTESKDGILGMLEGFALALEKLNLKIDFIFTGSLLNSPNYLQIKLLIELKNLHERVKFLGYLTDDELSFYQKNCCLIIINKNDNLQNNYCFPTKVGVYLSLAKPIIMTSVGELKKYFFDGLNAYMIESGKPELIAEKIIDIITNPDKSLKIGLEGKKLTETEFNYKNQGKRLVNFFENLDMYEN